MGSPVSYRDIVIVRVTCHGRWWGHLSFFQTTNSFVLLLVTQLFTARRFIRDFSSLTMFSKVHRARAQRYIGRAALLLIRSEYNDNLRVNGGLLQKIQPVLSLILRLITRFISRGIFTPLRKVANFLHVYLRNFTRLHGVINRVSSTGRYGGNVHSSGHRRGRTRPIRC